MYTVVFFKDRKGNEPVKEYLISLQEKAQSSKDSRIKLKKIYEYIGILSRNGTMAGEPYIKHIEADIWELRPLSDRIFLFLEGQYFYIATSIQKEKSKDAQKGNLTVKKKQEGIYRTVTFGMDF